MKMWIPTVTYEKRVEKHILYLCRYLIKRILLQTKIFLLEVLLKPGSGYSSGGTPEAQKGLFLFVCLSALRMCLQVEL
jgi:hypothetical protein